MAHPWSGMVSRSRASSIFDEDVDQTSGGGGGLAKLKKSASMTSLLSVFSRKGPLDEEDVPPVPKIPAEYASSGRVATVENFPAFTDIYTASAIDSESAIDSDVNDKKETPWLKVKKSFKSLRSLTASSSARPTLLTEKSPQQPHTAPVQQARFTLRGDSVSTGNSYDEEVIDARQFLDSTHDPLDSTSRLQTQASMSSLHSARTRANTSQASHEVGLDRRYEPRHAVFSGFGQQAPQDSRPYRRPAKIEDGPGDFLIAKTGAPAMPHSDVADIDPEYWESAVAYVRRQVLEEEAREAREAMRAAGQDSSPEKRNELNGEARKRRMMIGRDWIKRTSRVDWPVDGDAWADQIEPEDAAAAYNAVADFHKTGANESELKRLVGGILKKLFKGKSTPTAPNPDMSNPGSKGKEPSKPPTPDPSTPPFWKAEKEHTVVKSSRLPQPSTTPSSGFSRPPNPRTASAQRKTAEAQSSPITPEEHTPRIAKDQGSAKEDVTSITQATRVPPSRLPYLNRLKTPKPDHTYSPRFGLHIPGSTTTRDIPFEHEASPDTRDSPQPDRIDSPRVGSSSQTTSTPSLNAKRSSSTLGSSKPQRSIDSPRSDNPPQRPPASSTSFGTSSLSQEVSANTPKSQQPQRTIDSPRFSNLPQRPSASRMSSSTSSLNPKALSNTPRSDQPQPTTDSPHSANLPQRLPPGKASSGLPALRHQTSSYAMITPQPPRVWSPPSSDPPNRPLPDLPPGVPPWSNKRGREANRERVAGMTPGQHQPKPKGRGEDVGLGLHLGTPTLLFPEAKTSSPSSQPGSGLQYIEAETSTPSSQSPKDLRSPASMTFSPSGRSANLSPAQGTRKPSPLTPSLDSLSSLHVSKRATASDAPGTLASPAAGQTPSRLPAPSTKAASSGQPQQVPPALQQGGQVGDLRKYRSATEGTPSPLNPASPSTAFSSVAASSELGIRSAVSESSMSAPYPRDGPIAGLDLERIETIRRQRLFNMPPTDSNPAARTYTNNNMARRNPESESGLPQYEGTFSPQMDLDLHESATDPYGDDEPEMDPTPSKPPMIPPRRDFSAGRDDDPKQTMKNARDRAQDKITRLNLKHPAFRGPDERAPSPPLLHDPVTSSNNTLHTHMQAITAVPAAPNVEASEGYQQLRRSLRLPPVVAKQPNEVKHPNHDYAWGTLNTMCKGIHITQVPSAVNASDNATIVSITVCKTCGRECCFFANRVISYDSKRGDPFHNAEAERAKAMYEELVSLYPDGIEPWNTLLRCIRCAQAFCPACGTTCSADACMRPLCEGCAPIDDGACPLHERQGPAFF